ncbi:MAG: endonuclease Q family protein [archaeon]
MKIIADLHIHSRHSRACSSELTIANLEKWARIKGVNLLGTGDFSHPKWIEELKTELAEDGTGILRTKAGFPFVLQNEISLIYTQGGKGRRVHLVVLAPNFAIVEKITSYLKSKGRVDYDGRPMFSISCIDFAREIRMISDQIELIPAHAWTPWFGVFGSKTGFDSLEEAFGPEAKNIHAIETGLSSDPEMNRMLSGLDGIKIVSFSDLHSFWPWRIGREATIFEMAELTYMNLLKAIRTGAGLAGTIEVDPSYGKYHFDGHRLCGVSMSPEESANNKGICPACKRPLTIGVLNRVEQLADRAKPVDVPEFIRIIPLHELLSFELGSAMSSKKVWAEYYNVMKAGKDEFDILLNVSEDELLKVTGRKIVDLIMRNRRAGLTVKPGYDGEYGVLVVDGKEAAVESGDGESEDKAKVNKPAKPNQSGLNDFF